MKNRFLSAVIAASLSLGMLPSSLAAESSSPASFVTDFENGDLEGWSFSGGLVTGSEMTHETDEDGNGYARMKIASGTTVSTADGTMDKTPNASMVLDEPYSFVPGAKTVFAARVRFNGIPSTDLRIPFTINIPTNFNKTSGLKSFWTWISGTGFVRTEKNSGATTDLNYLPASHYGRYNYTSARNAMVAKSKLSADTWYTVKATITTDVNGKPESVTYNIKGGNIDYESDEQEVTQWSLLDDNSNKISTLNVVFDIRAALTEDFYYDIDDVVICQPEYEIELLNRVNDALFIKDEYFDVQFGVDMDKDSLKSGVKLINKADDSEVLYEGEYLDDERIFRITPSVDLDDGGEYRIEIDEAVISPQKTALKDIVTPVTSDMNFQYYASEVPLPPVVNNANISGLNYVGETLFAGYDYYHNTNEPEGNSEYKWYVGAGDYFEEITGENDRGYTVKSEDEGKFIKFSVKSKTKKSGLVSEEVMSESFGPIISGVKDTNMLTNPGFEEDAVSPWEITNKVDDIEISLAEDAHTGIFGMLVSGKTENESGWGQKINLEKNKTYIFSGYSKISGNSNWSSFNAFAHWWKGAEETNLTRPYYESEVKLITKDAWTNITQAVETSKDIEVYPSIGCNPAGKDGYEYLVDDLYVGELMIGDIKASVPTSVEVPEFGKETIIPLENTVVNQFGNIAGLYNEDVTWSISGGEGLVIDGDSLIVTDKAVEGEVMLIASCIPSYRGAVQKRFDKGFKINILADSNAVPRVDDVHLSGIVSEGAELVLDYSFYQANGKDDESVIKWYYSESETGVYKEIEGTEGLLNYTVTAEYKDKFIKCKITPVSEGLTGSEAESNVVCFTIKPQAKNVKITKEDSKGVFSGDVLTGSFEFYDLNGDSMGVSEYKWLRGDSQNGEFDEIEGADALTYTVTDEDTGKYIVFEVIPVSENEPTKGSAVKSEALKGPVLPEVKDISISKNGTVLTGKYKYYHEYGAPEGESRYEWIINGRVVSNEISYEAKAGGNVTFRVYPVSKQAPYEGECKEKTIRVASSSSSGGGGGGGSSSGGGMSISHSIMNEVINKTTEKIIQTDLANEKGYAADAQVHWAKEYVKNVLENDIMAVDSEKKFYPDKTVTRSEIIKYLFKTMKYTETEYKNEFSDVSADADYSGALQTFVDKEIISKDVNFRPDDNVSREEICKILSIMLGMGESDVSLDHYSDKALIGDWAVKHVKNMISAGIMVGVSENEFSPHTNITNAQLAKIISVILSGIYVEENNTPAEDNAEVEYIDLSSDEFKVAFIGGSLTELGKEWQEMTIDALEEKLPGKKITYINKGLGGTGSSYGAPRFTRDILSFEPDLVFIEFAANDRNLADETKAKMYMEQMVRMCQAEKKQPAVVFLFAPTPTEVLQNTLENWQNGVEWKSEVAEHYGIKTVNIQEYTFRDYENHKKANPNYTMTDYYIEYNWKQTGENSFDIHGGYVKYGEAIREAVGEDFDGFIRKPKNVGVHCVENKTVTEYEFIEINDPRLTFKGDWNKREKGFVSTDGNLIIADKHFPYFKSGIMQNDSGNASIEFTTDAAGIELQIISSKVGNSATVLIDGVEAGKIGTKNSNTNMNYPTEWIELPDDGKEHQVKIEVDEITEGYVFNVGSIMTRRYVK